MPQNAAPARRASPVRWALLFGGVLAVALAAWALNARGVNLPWGLGPGALGLREDAPPAFERTSDQNVLLVTIDTLRADAVGIYGGQAETPTLDALARSGWWFRFAHAHAVMTLPSHVSILSGLYPFEHGIRDNTGYRVSPETMTLATMLAGRGYATGAFVAAFPLHSQFGLTRGFDVYDDRFGESRLPMEFSRAERPAEAVVAAARAWIGQQDRRWFAWVHLFDPHAPYRPPPPFDRDYRYLSDPYAGEVAYTDRALAPLLETAPASSRPTLVIVTSDHGEALGDHGERTHGLFAYEATLRVPLIVTQLKASGPGPQATGVGQASGPEGTGTSSDLPARHIDLLPTVLDALQIEKPPALQGRSLLETSDQRRATDDQIASYFEAMSASLNRGWAPLSGVLVGREKYIELPLPELYDLAADPGETQNLAETRRDRTRVLQARLKSLDAGLPGERAAEDAATLARLRALGYVSGSAPRKTTYTEEDDPKRLIAVDEAIHRGIELFQQGRLDEAITVYQGAIAQRPDMALGYLHLAVLQWESGRRQAAVATLRSALARGLVNRELETRLGTYLAEAGEPGEALALLEASAAGGPADIDALNALGIAYARAGRADEALDAFRGILAIDRHNAMAYQNIGSLHLARGDLAQAREAFQRAIDADPRWAGAYTGLGVVEMNAGNRVAAQAHWQRAVELDPSDFDALYNLAIELVNDRQLAAARPYIERFVREAPRAAYAADIDRLSALLQRDVR